MRYTLFIMLLLWVTIAFGQNFTGKWQGELPQSDKSINFRIEFELKQFGNSLSGTSRFSTLDNHSVTYLVKGTINGKNIALDEYRVMNCDCNDRYIFCMKKLRGKLTVDTLNSHYSISGIWTSDSSYDGHAYIKSACSPGTFIMGKTVQLRPLDGYYEKDDLKSARVTAYANLRYNDAVFAKRIWREIDLREKMNLYLASPRQRLIDVLMKAVDDGQITAFDPTPSQQDPGGDSFLKRITPAEAKSRMADSSVVDKFDKDGNKTGSEFRAGEFNPDSIVKFRLKEDWVYDKQRSVFEPRIVGIAPLVRPKAAGLQLDYQPAFWIYFPTARRVLANKEAVNRNNDATGLSFDDVFMKRLFTSYIVKQSNDKDERVRDYTQGIDKLYESERIKKSLMEWELNLWQY